MVTVPFICPDTPPLKQNPLFLYSSDGFLKPYPFRADIAVAVHELESQVYEGGASGSEEFMRDVPPASDPNARKKWLRNRWEARQSAEANRAREALIKWYGRERPSRVFKCSPATLTLFLKRQQNSNDWGL
jgi:hypothetical protein